jgi:predicted outer membrane repeat protein
LGGGVLYNTSRTLLVEETTFFSCYSAASGGGGIFVNESGSLQVNNSIFDGCHSIEEGGGILFNGTEVQIGWAIFFSCYSNKSGGGAVSAFGNGTSEITLIIEDSLFLSCISLAYGDNESYSGAQLRIRDVTTSCSNCSFLNGQSNHHGGGIGEPEGAVSDYSLTLNSCIFASNRAEVRGGGVSTKGVNLFCDKCVFFRNSAGLGGGAFYGDLKYNQSFTDRMFIRNVVNVVNPEFDCNTGTAAVYVSPLDENIRNGSFSDAIFNKNEVYNCSSSSLGFFFFFFFFVFFIFFYFLFCFFILFYV